MQAIEIAHAPVAQLDRVTDYESVGQGFESLPAYQNEHLRVFVLFLFSGLEDSKSDTPGGRVSGDGSTEPHLCFRPFPDENANESLPAYQKNRYPIRDNGFSYMLGGTRKDGRAKRGKKVSGGHFFSPWESPLISGRIRYGCGPKSSILHAPKSNTFGCSFFFVFGTRRFKI